jgi:hypothetical protein
VRPDRRPVLAATTLGLLALFGCGDDQANQRLADRQAEVAERGADVMPFDLDATTHAFAPTGTGLVETVVADDPSDTDQIALIRSHLSNEADRFRRGDYSDPAAIHGQDMPGLTDLQAGAGSITITLDRLPDGARLTFSTDDPDLVNALHRWAEAQTTDHGEHADNAHS